MKLLMAMMILTAAFVPTTLPLPVASAGPVCVQSTDCDDNSICVRSTNCTGNSICVQSTDCSGNTICVNSQDCGGNSICIRSVHCGGDSICIDSRNCSAAKALHGFIAGSENERPCQTSTTISFTKLSTGKWSFTQYFTAMPDESSSCGGPGVIKVWRAYGDDTATLSEDRDSVTITRVVDTPGGPAFETTTLTFVDGGAQFDQAFTSADGAPSWRASGFLTTT